MSSDVTPGTAGFASSNAGAVAGLEVGEDHELRPRGLESAGAFTGVYDLNPGDDIEGAKATINVRDWWPWATLFISLGVLLGAWLRNWYQRVRPQSQLRIRAADVLDRARPLRAAAAVGGFDLGEVMAGKIDELVERLGELDKNGEAAAAGKLVDTFEAQLGRLRSLRDSLIDLDRNAGQVRQLALREELDPSTARLLSTADRLLRAAGSGVDLLALDADALKAQVESVATTSSLLARACGLHSTVVAHRELVKAILRARPVDPDTTAALATLLSKLDDLAAKTLQADTDSELAAYETEDDVAARYLRALARGPLESRIEPVVVLASEWPLDHTLDRSLLITANKPLGPVLRVDPSERKVRLSARVIAVGGADTIFVNDEVEFTAEVSPWPDASLTAIEFRYSDGPSKTVPIDATGKAVHRRAMGTSGPVTASIHSVSDGKRLDSAAIRVGTQSRGVAERSNLSDKDRAVALIAGALAVGSGLLSLYASDPAWGETSDYLAAALWGAVTAEGIRLAVAIADRAWPAG